RETYQRRGDFAEVSGPQMALRSSALVVDEPLGVTELGKTTYVFQVNSTPIARGTIKLKVFDQSESDPSVFVDNGEGGWSDGTSGSVDYFHGRLEITLPAAPSLIGQDILITYNQRIDAFPDIDNVRYTDRIRSSLVKFAISPKNPSIP